MDGIAHKFWVVVSFILFSIVHDFTNVEFCVQFYDKIFSLPSGMVLTGSCFLFHCSVWCCYCLDFGFLTTDYTIRFLSTWNNTHTSCRPSESHPKLKINATSTPEPRANCTLLLYVSALITYTFIIKIVIHCLCMCIWISPFLYIQDTLKQTTFRRIYIYVSANKFAIIFDVIWFGVRHFPL